MGEQLQCYDEAGNPAGSCERADKGDKWCGVSNVWLVNDIGQIFVSKRSEKVSGNPGKWQTYFGGHVPAGLSFRESAVKELKEEIDLSILENDLHLIIRGRDDQHKKFYESYAVRFNGQPSDLRFVDGEITEAKWMDMDDYWQQQELRPDEWCNRCKPEQQNVILKWLNKH